MFFKTAPAMAALVSLLPRLSSIFIAPSAPKTVQRLGASVGHRVNTVGAQL
jgi:hypothetical protein